MATLVGLLILWNLYLQFCIYHHNRRLENLEDRQPRKARPPWLGPPTQGRQD